MTTELEFLESWRTVLRDGSSRENPHAPESVLDVSFVVPDTIQETRIYLDLPGNERDGRGTGRLPQQLREALELFTLLSFVNNAAFQELLLSPTVIQPGCSVRWTMRLVGNQSANNATAAQTQVTWGAFLGCPDDPWEYSPEYRAAVQKLEAMGAEESSEAYSDSKPTIRWTCRLLNTRVHGTQEPDDSADVSRSSRVQLRNLFDIMVPPFVRVFATRGVDTLVNTCIPVNKPCMDMSAVIRNLAHPAAAELTVALARTATAYLRLDLEHARINSRQAMTNAGFLLSTLVCGKALRLEASNHSDFPDDKVPVKVGKLKLWCARECDRMFRSICSAVAELSTKSDISYNSVRTERWSWLIYALCCGSLDSLATEVSVSGGELTKSDTLAITAVLETHYPQPIMDSNGKGSHAYGFVDIREGTELHPRGLNGDNDSSFVLSRGCRCRALYDPNDSISWVNFVLPGYGICKAKLGEGVKFTPDSQKSVFPEKRLCGSLAIYHSTFETSAVLMELLTLVTHGLRSLELYINKKVVAAISIRIDLSALSMACPDLQRLSITEFNVIVSAHNESLCRWPVKTIAIENCTGPLSDLTRCLRNPTLRMARQLVEVKVTARKNALDEEGKRELKVHDGEFLPITKEKFPAESKAAMLSVVTIASSTTKPIHLGEDILSLVFAFASIPEQRTVQCWCKVRR